MYAPFRMGSKDACIVEWTMFAENPSCFHGFYLGAALVQDEDGFYVFSSSKPTLTPEQLPLHSCCTLNADSPEIHQFG